MIIEIFENLFKPVTDEEQISRWQEWADKLESFLPVVHEFEQRLDAIPTSSAREDRDVRDYMIKRYDPDGVINWRGLQNLIRGLPYKKGQGDSAASKEWEWKQAAFNKAYEQWKTQSVDESVFKPVTDEEQFKRNEAMFPIIAEIEDKLDNSEMTFSQIVIYFSHKYRGQNLGYWPSLIRVINRHGEPGPEIDAGEVELYRSYKKWKKANESMFKPASQDELESREIEMFKIVNEFETEVAEYTEEEDIDDAIERYIDAHPDVADWTIMYYALNDIHWHPELMSGFRKRYADWKRKAMWKHDN